MSEQPCISSGTKESPRFVSDTLVFYQGDTFDIEFVFDITAEGVPVVIGENDKIVFEFYRQCSLPDTVITEIPGAEIESNTAVLHWTKELTDQFRRGIYVYRIRLVSDGITSTIAADAQMIVE